MNRTVKLMLFALLIGLSSTHLLYADNGFKLEINVTGFSGEFVILGYRFGDNTYIKDTVFAAKSMKGKYVFESPEPLEPGMYMLVFPPDNKSVDLLINANEKPFSMDVKLDGDLTLDTKFKDSPENTLFYDYLRFLNEKRKLSEKYRTELDQAKKAGDKEKEKAVTDKLLLLNKEVLAQQANIVNENKPSFTAAFIRAGQEVETPPAPTDEKGNVTDSLFQYRFYKKHYFDNLDLGDERLLRTPFLHDRVMRYIDQVVIQHPDSINKEIDFILKQATNSDVFNYLLVKLINKYAQSKIVGMDAIYVHIALNYLDKGKTGSIDDDQVQKIVKDARKLEPLLIGKPAPDFYMQYVENPQAAPVSLYQVKAKYTVLIFWSPDCGHCKKAMPSVDTFYQNFKDKDIKVFSVCTKKIGDRSACADFIKEKNLGSLINVISGDEYQFARYQIAYDIKMTPIVYVLDKDKKIISKRIGPEQLTEIMPKVMKIYK